MLAQAISNSVKDRGIDIEQLPSVRDAVNNCHDTNNEVKCSLHNSNRRKNCQACEMPRHCSQNSLSDTMLSNDTASNARENIIIPSIKYVWARQGSHIGATSHEAQLLDRPLDDDNCVWVKWATGDEECIPETHLVEMPSKRQRKCPNFINLPVMKAAASMVSGQKYSIGTSVSKVFFVADKGWDCPFSGEITAYDPKEGLYLVTYEDGDKEELNEVNVGQIVVDAFNKVSKSLQHGKQEMPSKTATKWSIFNDLKMTQEKIEESLPDSMREMFHECCWVEWEGWHRPVLILSPFDLSGDVDIVKRWTEKYKTNRNNLSELPFMVYWYEQGWSRGDQKTFKAFSFVKRAKIIDYELGLTRGYHTPFEDDFKKFGYELTPTQDNIIRGIRQMKEDSKLNKAKRGGPMFFPHLKHELKEKYKNRMDDHETRYNSWLMSDKYTKCINATNLNQDEGIFSNTDKSLELFSGTAVMSDALKAVGFNITTLDSDPNRDAMSKLSIRALEEMIIERKRFDGHQHLDKRFNVIWAAPCCTTWSKAANGMYRNIDFIDGFPFYKSEERAIQARKDIESLVNVLAFYLRRNPELIITIENPVGLLRHHPVEQLFYKVLGLSLVTISYCMFSTQCEEYPSKNTDLWTNSSRLLSEFGDKKFLCRKENCGCKANHIKVQDMPDRCSSYPREVCRRISALLRKNTKKSDFELSKLFPIDSLFIIFIFQILMSMMESFYAIR
jgi:hypothetical protein